MTNTISKSILVIEDEPDLQTVVKLYLETENYKVLTANNGVEAMELLKRENIPDLILLDMKMPVMNGWEFAAEFLKAHDHHSPIVVMTAAADPEQRAKDINAADWVSKPFELDMLLEKIKKNEK